MEQNGVVSGILGRVGTAVGASGAVVVADHSTIVQGALVALLGVGVDLFIRWLRQRLGS